MSYTNPDRPGVMHRMLAAVGLRRGEKTLALPAPDGFVDPAGEASPDAAFAPAERGDAVAGTPDPSVRGDTPRGAAQRSPADTGDSLDDQLRRVREVLEEHDPLAPRATRPAAPAAPPRERVSLTVRLETPIDADVLAGSPGRPSRIAEATLSQLPEGARIVGLVVETYVD